MPVAKEKSSSWWAKAGAQIWGDGERQQLEGTFLEDGSRVLKEGGKAWDALGGGCGVGEMVKSKRLAPGTIPSTARAVSSADTWI